PMPPGDFEFTGTSRFAVRRRLGSGGMGVVYEVFDAEQRARVALKTLRNLDERSLLRFKNEFRALADLLHPNLIRLGELYFENSQWFFTMELVEGTAFLPWVWKGTGNVEPTDSTVVTAQRGGRKAARPARRFDEPRLRRALAQLCEGVSALHAAG